MNQVLRDLNRFIDAKGSLVITADGIPIASEARSEFHVERLSALALRIIREAEVSCGMFGDGRFAKMVLTADHGRMIFVRLPVAYLIVITSLGSDTEQALLEIETAARKIERSVRIAV